jgi:hypothetical protein
MIRGHLHDVGTPAIGATIVGRLPEAKTMNEPVTRVVITAAAGPADVIGSERAPRHLLGRIHHGGAGRPQDGIEMEIGGMIIEDDETVWVV